MPAPTYFPQLSSGSSAQLPYTSRKSFESVISDMDTGKRYTYAKLVSPLSHWDLNFSMLTDANRATIESFFNQQQGRLQPFTFLDPAGNLCQYSEDFSQAAWVKSGLTLGAAVADPFGGNGATSISSTGTNGNLSTLVLPNGGASGFVLCGSVWAKAAAANQQLTIGLADHLLTILGSSTWDLAQGVWTRIFFSMTLASSDNINLLIGGLNTWGTSQVISLFGAQCVPLPGPGGYAKSPGDYGLHSNCRFDTDKLELTANEPNSWSLRLPIQEHN